jgi:hypothetical protein
MLGAAGEVRGVASATALVVRAAVRATNAYVEADDLMAGDARAREAASSNVAQLGNLAKRDQLDRGERLSLDQWLANQQGLRR